MMMVNGWKYDPDELMPVVQAIKDRVDIKQPISSSEIDYISAEYDPLSSRTMIKISRRDGRGRWNYDTLLHSEYTDGASDDHLSVILVNLCQEFINGVRDSVQDSGEQ